MPPRDHIRRVRLKKPHKRRRPYVNISRKVLWRPPIKHRHTSDSENFLKPFEFAVAMGAILLAWQARSHDLHQRAFERGAKAIDNEVRTGERYKAHTEFNEGYGFKVQPRGHDIRQAGSRAYQRRRKTLAKLSPPEVVEVNASRSALLRAAGLPSNGVNARKLKATLDRLCRPVGKDMPGPLRSYSIPQNGRLRLTVDGMWLAPAFARVPITVADAFTNCIGVVSVPAHGPYKHGQTGRFIFQTTVRTARYTDATW